MNSLPPWILAEPAAFISEVEKRLGELPIDYAERYLPSDLGKKGADRRLMAGTLVLLTEATAGPEGASQPAFNLLLIKRSSMVSQGGDLSSPGGILQPNLDCWLRLLIVTGILPVLQGLPRQRLKDRDKRTFELATLFLANALRETWEEIGLSPCNIHFLGALPSYSLTMFSRTIFPILALIKKPTAFKLNHEVEKIVSIPLISLLREENYGLLKLEFPDSPGEKPSAPGFFPCFIHHGRDSRDVLWGATYQIVISFMKLFFSLPDPGNNAPPVIVKTVDNRYLKGDIQSPRDKF